MIAMINSTATVQVDVCTDVKKDELTREQINNMRITRRVIHLLALEVDLRQDAQLFLKSNSHLKIVGITRVMQSSILSTQKQ